MSSVRTILNGSTVGSSEPSVVIEPRRGLFHLDLKSIWQYRVLLYFLVWRDLKVRYKQTIIGVGWAIIQPFISMVIFTLIFGIFARLPSDGLPYPIFAYTALLPWNYFASALNRCTASVVGDANLVTKVYFPRLVLPLVGTISGLIDFLISFILLLGLMAWYGIPPTVRALSIPLFLFFALLTALAVGLWLAAINVRYRDVGYTMPFVMQVWMFLSPIVYPTSIIPQKYRVLYTLNPMVGVIEGFRWALLGKGSPDLLVITVSAAVVCVVLLTGLVFFKRMEQTFADVI